MGWYALLWSRYTTWYVSKLSLEKYHIDASYTQGLSNLNGSMSSMPKFFHNLSAASRYARCVPGCSSWHSSRVVTLECRPRWFWIEKLRKLWRLRRGPTKMYPKSHLETWLKVRVAQSHFHTHLGLMGQFFDKMQQFSVNIITSHQWLKNDVIILCPLSHYYETYSIIFLKIFIIILCPLRWV